MCCARRCSGFLIGLAFAHTLKLGIMELLFFFVTKYLKILFEVSRFTKKLHGSNVTLSPYFSFHFNKKNLFEGLLNFDFKDSKLLFLIPYLDTSIHF